MHQREANRLFRPAASKWFILGAAAVCAAYVLPIISKSLGYLFENDKLPGLYGEWTLFVAVVLPALLSIPAVGLAVYATARTRSRMLLVPTALWIVAVLVLLSLEGHVRFSATAGVGTAIVWWSLFRFIEKETEEGCCGKCGYNLRGLLNPRCPECGEPFDPKLLAEAGRGPGNEEQN